MLKLETLTTWDNLWLAYRKASKGKRGHMPAADFEYGKMGTTERKVYLSKIKSFKIINYLKAS